MFKKYSLIICGILLANLIFAQEQQEYKKFKGWKKAETEHFNFIFEEESRLAAENYAIFADEAWNKVSKIYGMPQDKTNVYVIGRTNTVNAFTYFSPAEIVMFNSPVLFPDFTFRDNWMKLFFTHELIHIANVNLEDKSQIAKKLLGSYYTSFDLVDVPRWALEGLTTVLETELTNGGRGRSPYFELMYKAPTLDNSFISYDEIGLEKEPPQGQSYVMGYLIMRSIADRWGISALADIERNRSFTRTWDDSVKLVTGETASDIYKDVRIALSKKYREERSIPEGKIISPRETNTFYYKPAAILDDGSIITLRTKENAPAAVVKFDPSLAAGSKNIEDTYPEKDLNSVTNETILFTGSFCDSTSVAADLQGNIYASMGIQRQDRKPGNEIQYALFKWSKEQGLKQLTKNTSIYQPTVSADGKLLVAVQQKGMDMQLVKIDTETGDITPILYKEGLSFIQPSVNSDGSKLAFLVLDNERAFVATSDFDGNYKILANNEEKIYDPSTPSWNSDNKLTFTCNYRGRLEVFEYDEETETPRPVVADPIGALWAYKTERGIYYSSYASSGNVIKMKPLSAWGEVPDFEGPSIAGEKICFGNLEDDYPDFKPYVLLSEVEIQKDESEEKKTKKGFKESLKEKTEKSEEPIPIKGKEVKHRDKENIEKAEKATSTQTVLENEKNYFILPQPVLYFPIPYFKVESEKFYPGFGYTVVALMPKLQLATGFTFANLNYIPELNNFDGSLGAIFNINNSEFDIAVNRLLNFSNAADKNFYSENNLIMVGYSLPFIRRFEPLKEIDVTFISNFIYSFVRADSTYIPINSDLKYDKNLLANAGVEFLFTKKISNSRLASFDFGISALGMFDFDLSKFFVGAEFEASGETGSNYLRYGFEVKGRYTDFPSKTDESCINFQDSGIVNNCEFPGLLENKVNMIIPNVLFNFIDVKCFGEFQFLFGRNTVDFETPDTGNLLNFKLNDTWGMGTELFIKSGHVELGYGVSFLYDFDFNYKDCKLFLNAKYNGFRN